jgi:hypothetical protein
MLGGDCTSAILLSRLISLHTFFKSSGLLEEGWFFQKVKDIEDKLGINDYHQRKSFKELKECGFIDYKLVGSPPIRYFSIKFKAIEKALMLETKPDKKKFTKNKPDKSEFYTQLNSNEAFDNIDSVRGNIPRFIGEFLYAFKMGVGYSFSGWNPESYGMIARYLERAYINDGRPFSYVRLKNWLESKEPKTVKSFIEFDKNSHPDMDRPVTIEKFLREM